MKLDKSLIWKYAVLFAMNALILAIYIIVVMFNSYPPIAYLVLGIYVYFVLPLYPIVYGIVAWFLTKNLLFPNLLLIICLGVIPRSFFTISILLAAVSLVTELIVRAITKACERKKQAAEEQLEAQSEREAVIDKWRNSIKLDKSIILEYILLFIINALLLVSFYICIILYQNSPTSYLVLTTYFYCVLPIYTIAYGIVAWFLTKNLLFPNLLLIICLGVIPRSFFIISILLAAGSFVIELILYAITKAFKRKKQVEEEQSVSQFEDEIVPAGLSEK